MTTVPIDAIAQNIHLIRGHKVLLGMDLAGLYAVEHRALMQAVRRNPQRFPEDFMFQLSPEEWENLKSQFVISSWGGLRKESAIRQLMTPPTTPKRPIGFTADLGSKP